MKLNGAFKPKHLSIVIVEAYPIIFHQKFPQDNSSANSILPFYRDRVLEMEKKVYRRLFCDIFIPDISYLPLFTSGGQLTFTSDIEIVKDATTFLCTLLFRIGSKTIEIQSPESPSCLVLCNEALKILPFDLIQWSSSLILSILHAFLRHYYHRLHGSQLASLSPLDEEILQNTLRAMSPSSLFFLHYRNAMAYYPSCIRDQSSNCLNWSVALIAHILLSLLSSSEIRLLSDFFLHSLELTLAPDFKITKCMNSLFGSQQQWKYILSKVPSIFHRWIGSVNSYFQPSLPRLKTRSLCLMRKNSFDPEKANGEILTDFQLSPDDHNGWIQGTNISRIFVEDRMPIFIPATDSSQTTKNAEVRRKHDEDFLPSSDGTIYGYCSVDELRAVNYHPDECAKTPLFALIPSPSIKTQLRELKKYHQYNTSSNTASKYLSSAYGLSTLCLAEITMFQYLHYFQRIDDALNNDYFEGLACPITIVYDQLYPQQTHYTLYYSQLVSKENLEETTIPSPEPELPSNSLSSLSSVIQAEDTNSILELLTTHRNLTSTAHSSPKIDKSKKTESLLQEQSDLPASSLLTYLYGLYPAAQCHIPLNSVLPFLRNPDVCSSSFLHDLSKELVDIFHYCFRKGVVFKYIPYDYLHISTNGRLVLNSLQGASFNYCSSQTSPHKSAPTTSPFGPYLSVTSPEVIYGSTPTESSTVWSVMAVCYFLFTGYLVHFPQH